MNTSKLYPNEANDLELHVSICSERYKQLDDRLGKLETDVSEIKTDVANGNKSLKTTIITSSGTIVVALIGLIATLLNK